MGISRSAEPKVHPELVEGKHTPHFYMIARWFLTTARIYAELNDVSVTPKPH